MFDDRSPIYHQIAEKIKKEILVGDLGADEQVMSTNQYAAFYRINPATAAKGINILVDDGVLEKRRGIGMFVVVGARERLIQLRRKEFADQFIDPLLVEARRLGIGNGELIDLIRHAPEWPEPQEHAETQAGEAS